MYTFRFNNMHILPEPLRLRSSATTSSSNSPEILTSLQKLSLFPPSRNSRIDMFCAWNRSFGWWSGESCDGLHSGGRGCGVV